MLNGDIRCGGVSVSPGDIVIADEEGIAVIPAADADAVLQTVASRKEVEAQQTHEQWEQKHRAKIESLLQQKGLA